MTGYVTDGAAVRLAIAARRSPPAGAWGMGILIASEAMLFGAFIATYYYLRFHTASWPPPGIPEPDWLVPLVLVAILAATSVPMHLAWRSAREGRVVPARLLVAAAFFVQAGYLAYEVHDFHQQLKGTAIGTNAYTSITYVLLGADHAHVFVGLLLSLWLLWKLAHGLNVYRANATQAIVLYWHFVNVLTVVILAVLLSARI